MSTNNDDKQPESRFMKRMVILCAVVLIILFVAAYVGYWFGIDMDVFLTVGSGAFSMELAINAWIKALEIKKNTGDQKPGAKTTKKVNG